MTSILWSRLRNHRVILRRALIAVAATYVLYLVAANVFLNSALAERAFNQKPERFHVQWDRAMSLYPGHIHVSGLQVGGHSRATSWSAQSPAADGRLKLLPLLARQLSFGTIDADKVSVRIEHSDTVLAPSKLSAPAGLRDPWGLHFDAIRTASLGAVRWDDWVVDGGGEASFAMDKTLRGGVIAILPSHVHLPAARVRRGDTVLARDATFDLTFSMAPSLPTAIRGVNKLQLLDARLQVSGRAPGLDVRELGKDGALTFAKSAQTGAVDLDLGVHRGVLQPGGRLRWTAPILLDSGSAAAHDYAVQVAADVQADAVALRVRVPKRAGSEDFVDADLRVAERRPQRMQLGALRTATSGTVKLRWQFATLRWANPWLSSGWLRLDGAAELITDLRLHEGKLQPGSTLEIPRADVQADVFDTVASGQARAIVKVEAARTTADFVAQHFQLAPRDAPGSRYVEGSNLRLRLVSEGELVEFRRKAKAILRFDNARIPRLTAYNRNLPGDSLKFAGGSGTVSADLALDADGTVSRGNIQLRGDDADIRFGTSRVIGDLSLDTQLVSAGKGPRAFRIDRFALALADVRVDGSDGPPWWARFALENGTLQWQQPFRLDSKARLQMRDVSVLLSLFAQRSALPKWIGRLIDSGQASATAQVRVAGDTVTLDDIRLSNARVELDARLRVAAGRPYGDLYARWGVLGVAAEVRGDQRKLHIAGAKRWYEAQPALLGGAAPK